MREKYSKLDITVNQVILAKLIFDIILIAVSYTFLKSGTIYLDSTRIYSIYSQVCDHFFNGKYFDSYYNVARFYAVLTLKHTVSYGVVFVMGSMLWCGVYAFMIKSAKIKNLHLFLPISIIFIFDAVFMMQPAKDTFVLFINTLVMILLRNNKKNRFYVMTALLLLEGIFIKPYILIFVIIYGLVHLFEYNKRYGIIALIAGCTGFTVLMQTGHLDFLINARIIGEANTTITEVFSKSKMYGNTFLYVINYLVSLIRMLFPFELFIKAPSRAIFFVPLQMGILVLWYRTIKYLIIRKKAGKLDDKDRIIKECIYILIVYTLVSAMFEPDFGSVMRHQCGYLPFFIYLLFEADWRQHEEIK